MGIVSKVRSLFGRPIIAAGRPRLPGSITASIESILDAHELLPPQADPEPEPEPEIVPPPTSPPCPFCGCCDLKSVGKIRRMGRLIERRNYACQNRNCRKEFRLTIRPEGIRK